MIWFTVARLDFGWHLKSGVLLDIGLMIQLSSIEKNDRILNSLFRVVEMLNAWILIALESRA